MDQSAAYVAHIVAQMQQNVAFLASQGHISQSDADTITARLPAVRRNGFFQGTTPLTPPASAPATPGRRVVPPPPPARAVVQARAIWAYNEDGSDADDLSFSPGDIIEIVAETNADWWTGKAKGRQGLFPANHVEKLAPSMPTPTSPPQYYPEQQAAPIPAQKAVYKPFMAAHHGSDVPPPASAIGEPARVNSVGLQQAPGQEQKKSKYGKLGNTMANSAAGGVGFGAGAAIGGGLVRAIF